jgi:DNA-binding YbaB/EbfC family protein
MSDQQRGGSEGGAAPDDMAGAFDLGALLDQAQQMQQQLLAAQQEQASQVVTGESAGGKVRVEMTGSGEFRSVSIDPGVVDPGEVDLLEDLVLTALRDAANRAAELQAQTMRGLGLGDLLDG